MHCIRALLLCLPLLFPFSSHALLRSRVRSRSLEPTITNPRPICIPLVSVDIRFNPYHNDLLSRPGSHVRYVHGVPKAMTSSGLQCTNDDLHDRCTISMSQQTTVGWTSGFSVSSGKSEGTTIQHQDTVSRSETDTVMDEVSNTISNTFQNTATHTTDTSIANSVHNELAKTHEEGVGKTDTKTIEDGTTEGQSTELGASVEVGGMLSKAVGVSGSASVSHGWSSQHNHQESESHGTEQHQSDSMQYSGGRSSESRKGVSDAVSTSTSVESSLTQSMSMSHAVAVGREHSESVQRMNEIRSEQSFHQEQEQTYSMSQSLSMDVVPGAVYFPVCAPVVRAISLLFLCLSNSSSGIWDEKLVHVDLAFADTGGLTNNTIPSVCSFMAEEEFLRRTMVGTADATFQSLRIKEDPGDDAIRYGSTFGPGTLLKKQDYRLELMDTGNLVIRKGRGGDGDGEILWESGTGITTRKTEMKEKVDVRARITKKGHFIVEATNLFQGLQVSYRPNQWISIWSSAPIHHNVTIGYHGPGGVSGGHFIAMKTDGNLQMYDYVGVVTWCTAMDCNHRLGYKYPDIYLVPTFFTDDAGPPPGVYDPHNTMPHSVNFSRNHILLSEDQKCDYLVENEGLKSSNKRFALILQNSGNLVIKDGSHTMWSSYTAGIPGRIGPYSARLTPECFLLVTDGQGYMIYATNPTNQSGNCTLEVLDEGRVVIRDGQGADVWESWPLQGLNTAYNVYKTMTVPSTLCPRQYYNATKNAPQSEEPTPKRLLLEMVGGNSSCNYLYENSFLVSRNGKWSFGVEPQNGLVANGSGWSLYVPGVKVVVFGSDGRVTAWDGNATELWSHGIPQLSSANSYLLAWDESRGKLVLSGSQGLYWPLPVPKFLDHLEAGTPLQDDTYLISPSKCFVFGYCPGNGISRGLPGCLDVVPLDKNNKDVFFVFVLSQDGSVLGYDDKGNNMWRDSSAKSLEGNEQFAVSLGEQDALIVSRGKNQKVIDEFS